MFNNAVVGLTGTKNNIEELSKSGSIITVDQTRHYVVKKLIGKGNSWTNTKFISKL